MSETKLFWFHCGRCGALFQAEPGLNEERVCAVCGADPCLPTIETAAPAAAAVSAARSTRAKSGSRGSRKPKHRHLMLKLILGWTLVLALIVLGARKLWHKPQAADQAPALAGESITLNEEEVEIMQTAGQQCGRVFEGFIAAGTPEQRNQFVLAPLDTVSRMTRFYSMNPMPSISAEKLEPMDGGILRLPGGNAYEARWKSQDGQIYDTVFRRENDEWRLDWDHFARYSDYPWALFIAGSGPDEGEFRLLARERLAEERKAEPAISLVLYAPRFGSPRETGFQSPEFLVPRDSPAGRLIGAAFQLSREGGRVFGGKLEEINPDGMIRIRVKVRRFEEDMQRKFEIAEVLACHWLSVDDPGVEPLEPPAPATEETAE
ncbi:MAG TPA: hypothetical protein VLO11_07630 [Luteolibacter sp.]|nr:hypothetical protein [Luteolibacter sp.]